MTTRHSLQGSPSGAIVHAAGAKEENRRLVPLEATLPSPQRPHDLARIISLQVALSLCLQTMVHLVLSRPLSPPPRFPTNPHHRLHLVLIRDRRMGGTLIRTPDKARKHGGTLQTVPGPQTPLEELGLWVSLFRFALW